MKMKKFINDPSNLTPELLEGFAAANKYLVRLNRLSAGLSEKVWWTFL